MHIRSEPKPKSHRIVRLEGLVNRASVTVQKNAHRPVMVMEPVLTAQLLGSSPHIVIQPVIKDSLGKAVDRNVIHGVKITYAMPKPEIVSNAGIRGWHCPIVKHSAAMERMECIVPKDVPWRARSLVIQ